MLIGVVVVCMNVYKLAFWVPLLAILMMDIVSDGSSNVDNDLFPAGLARSGDVVDES